MERDLTASLGLEDMALCRWFRGTELHTDSTNFFACNGATWASWFADVGFTSLTELLRLPGAGASLYRSIYVALKPGATMTAHDFEDFSV